MGRAKYHSRTRGASRTARGSSRSIGELLDEQWMPTDSDLSPCAARTRPRAGDEDFGERRGALPRRRSSRATSTPVPRVSATLGYNGGEAIAHDAGAKRAPITHAATQSPEARLPFILRHESSPRARRARGERQPREPSARERFQLFNREWTRYDQAVLRDARKTATSTRLRPQPARMTRALLERRSLD